MSNSKLVQEIYQELISEYSNKINEIIEEVKTLKKTKLKKQIEKEIEEQTQGRLTKEEDDKYYEFIDKTDERIDMLNIEKNRTEKRKRYCENVLEYND